MCVCVCVCSCSCVQAAASEWAAWRSQVNDKRRRENEENLRRWRRLEEVFRQSQENLASLISGKERRARELLTLQRQARVRGGVLSLSWVMMRDMGKCYQNGIKLYRQPYKLLQLGPTGGGATVCGECQEGSAGSSAKGERGGRGTQAATSDPHVGATAATSGAAAAGA